MLSYVSRFLLNYVFGFTLQGNPPTSVKKAIVIGYPHTYIYDGILVGIVSNIYYGYIIMKGETFFYKMIAYIFGQLYVDRSLKQSQTDRIANFISNKEKCLLFISPEGTRKYHSSIKTGFFYIAKKANIPIICGSINFKNKTYSFSEPYYINNKCIKTVFSEIEQYYNSISAAENAFYPKNVTPFKLSDQHDKTK